MNAYGLGQTQSSGTCTPNCAPGQMCSQMIMLASANPPYCPAGMVYNPGNPVINGVECSTLPPSYLAYQAAHGYQGPPPCPPGTPQPQSYVVPGGTPLPSSTIPTGGTSPGMSIPSWMGTAPSSMNPLLIFGIVAAVLIVLAVAK